MASHVIEVASGEDKLRADAGSSSDGVNGGDGYSGGGGSGRSAGGKEHLEHETFKSVRQPY